MMKPLFLFVVPVLGMLTAAARAEAPSITAKLNEAAKTVRVEIGGSLFTELVYAGQAKPLLFPIIGPGGMMVVRQWPLMPAAPGEAPDHPHHKGLWFTHGKVNGTDFWMEGPKAGKIMVTGVPEIVVGPGAGAVTLKTKESWQKPDGSTVMTSATGIVCGTEGEDRFIDYTITLSASEGEVLLGDTKEGTMGLRLGQLFNFKAKTDKGSVLTSEGKSGAAAWGSAAKWVDYNAPGTDGVIGVACFDHPSNLRHPTAWHARDYGLVAANPFGLHDFQKQPEGAGDYTLKKDATLTLRYRWLFHKGDTASAKIEKRWQAWAK